MGLVHEPPLLRGVVNPWQTKCGTQCGTYGQWIGPFTYQQEAELFHEIARHPTTKQYQQLMHVSQQAANTRSCMKNSFFLQDNTSKHMKFPKWLAGWHLAVCNPIAHSTSAGNHVLRDSAQLPLWDAMIHDSKTCSIPWGNIETWRTSVSRGGGTSPILKWSGRLSREVILESTCVGEKKERKLCSEHFIVPGALNFMKSARSTELS